MICPVCATEMNNSPKCPFCGHVCSPDEDNTVTLNGEVISTGHRNHWCRTTDNPHLEGKMVNGTHYHPQEPYASASYAADQTAPGPRMSDPDTAGRFDQNISIQGDLIPFNPNQGIPNQEIIYNNSGMTGMQMQMPGDNAQRQKVNKTVKWVLIIFIVVTWGLPVLFAIIAAIIAAIVQITAG